MASPFGGGLAAAENRNGFLSYGLGVRFQLLSTSSLNDAVTFSYGTQAWDPAGTFPPLTAGARRRTATSLRDGEAHWVGVVVAPAPQRPAPQPFKSPVEWY